jgi:tetratricopeptide (TPR) repeat protein
MRIVVLALASAMVGCASSPARTPSADAPSRAAVDSSETASSPAELLAAARRYTRRGDRHVQRCELDTARADIERAVRTFEQSLRSSDVDYAEALGARSHLRKQLNDLPGAALDLSRSIALLGRHERDTLPSLFSAYAELVSVYQAAGRHADAHAAVQRSIDIALRHASTTVAPAELAADYDGLVVLADRYARVADAATVARWDDTLDVTRWSMGAPWDGEPPSNASAAATSRWPTCRASADAYGPVVNTDVVVSGLEARFRACYQQALRDDPDAQGALRVMSRVGPDGRVVSSRGVGIGLGSETYGCITREILSARFDPPARGAAVIAIPISLVQEPAAVASQP